MSDNDHMALREPNTMLSQYRQTMLRQTAEIVLHPSVQDSAYQSNMFSHLSALLASSLEELRVAEDELNEHSALLASRHAEIQQVVENERRRFVFAPVALLVTNVSGSILDANLDALGLLDTELQRIERKPLVAFVPTEERATFRSQLSRVLMTEDVRQWSFHITRRRDVPVLVTASVRVGASTDGDPDARALYWSIHPVWTRGTPPG